MKVSGTVTLQFSQEDVWNAFMDPDFVAQVIPGCDSLQPTENPDEYTANLKIRIGPIQGRFKANLVQSDRQPQESFRMTVQAKGPVGFIKGGGKVSLEALGDHTTMHYAGDVNVGGRIAGVGQRLIETTTKSMINKGIGSFRTRMEEVLGERGQTG